MTIDPHSITVGDKIQAIVDSSRETEQPVGTVTAIAGDLVTFLAEGEYDMYYHPGHEDYYLAYREPKLLTVPVSTIRFHWAKDR
jgi:hypothetical protein